MIFLATHFNFFSQILSAVISPNIMLWQWENYSKLQDWESFPDVAVYPNPIIFHIDIPQPHCWKCCRCRCLHGNLTAPTTVYTPAQFILKLLKPELKKKKKKKLNATCHLLPDQMAQLRLYSKTNSNYASGNTVSISRISVLPCKLMINSHPFLDFKN